VNFPNVNNEMTSTNEFVSYVQSVIRFIGKSSLEVFNMGKFMCQLFRAS
jgi:hypothetical protein